MGTEGVYIRVEYTKKVDKLARKMNKTEAQVRQLALELGLDTLLELSRVQ